MRGCTASLESMVPARGAVTRASRSVGQWVALFAVAALTGCLRDDVDPEIFQHKADVGARNAHDAVIVGDSDASVVADGAGAAGDSGGTAADAHGSVADAAATDAGFTDVGGADASSVDAGSADSGAVDTGQADGGAADSGLGDDTGPPPDAGPTGCKEDSDCIGVFTPAQLGPCKSAKCYGGTCGKEDVTGGDCEDGNACTEGDNCLLGTCLAGTAKACDDGSVCTVDTCDAAKGCVLTPVKDGTACEGNKICVTGKCTATGQCGDGAVNQVAEVCDDGNTTALDGCSDQCKLECATLVFDGATAYASAPHKPALDLSDGDFTLEAMVRFAGGWSKDQTIASKRPQLGTGIGWTWGIWGGKYAFRLGGGSQVTASAAVDAPLPTDKWLHLAVVYDKASQTLSLWRNGELLNSQSGFPNPSLSFEPLHLGQEDTSGKARLKGELAWLRISKVRRYKGPFSTPLYVQADALTLAYFGIKEGSGTKLTDLSDGANHATTAGQTIWQQNAPACSKGAACGDGTLSDLEQCDDGNQLFGDGCSKDCKIESVPLGGLVGASFVYDASTTGGWLFGGETFYDLNGSLWRYSANQQQPTWTEMKLAPAPPPRTRALFVRDPAGKKAWVFGGQGYYELYDDLWQLTELPDNGAMWSKLSPKGAPPKPRHAAVGWWDSKAKRFVVGLGETFYDLLDDFHAYDPATSTWTQLTISGSIAPRRHAMAAWDEAMGVAWIAGGETWYDALGDLHKVTVTGNGAKVEAVSLAFGAMPALLSGCAVAHAGVMMLVGGQGYYRLNEAALKLTGASGKVEVLAGPGTLGGVCLLKGDGTVMRMMGQGWFELAAGAWSSKL